MEILRYREINKGCVIGNFSMKIQKWGIIINDCTLFDKNGRKWISFPQRQYDDKGVKKYMPYIQFENKAHSKPFEDMVMAAIEKFKETMPAEQPKNTDQGELPF